MHQSASSLEARPRSPADEVNQNGLPGPSTAIGRRVWLFIRAQGPFLSVAVQFGLIVLLVWGFHLESLTFARLITLSFAGFLIHHYLPSALRWSFFAFLSVVGTIAVVHMPAGLILVAIGVGLIGICHLPIPFWGRTILLGAIAATLTVLRAQSESFPALEGIWSILASMFIFRILLYMYDLKHGTAQFSLTRAVSYFFMLPNVCFPLFPVVDYKTFCTTYYNNESSQIYQSGLLWMMCGIIQLLIYRLIYQFGLLNIADVTDAKSVAKYVVATYLLYLHVSGQFHLIVGLLHMFGFNLPETHHRYLLASSFTDFWRRINIYWKDFIMKLFFYPAFFTLRRIGTLPAIAVATLFAFFATWALHSWQWFWFRGKVIFTWQDVSFWAILAILVLVNALFEAVAGRRRSLSRPRFDLWVRLWVGLKTVGTFVVICSLWTLWSSQSWDELRVLAEAAAHPSWTDIAFIAAGAALLCGAGMLWGVSTRASFEGGSAVKVQPDTEQFWRSVATTTATAICLLALLPASQSINTPIAARLFAALRQDQMNAGDVDWQRRGYYEELDVVRANYRVWDHAIEQPAGWVSQNLFRKRDDFLKQDMAPSSSGILCGTLATTNQWGMRDREYEMEKPIGTYRIVLLGSSHEVGSGVKDDETFESLVENRLNESKTGPQSQRYEILNLSVGGYGVLRKLVRLERDGFKFAPDAVIFSLNAGDRVFDLGDMAVALRPGTEIPYDYLRELFKRARVDGRLESLVIKHRLQPYIPEVFKWAFKRIGEECSQREIRVWGLYRPAVIDPAGIEPNRHSEIVGLARDAGLEIIDLSSAFDHVEDRNLLVLSPWDDHTNAIGHKLLAEKLYLELSQKLVDKSQVATRKKVDSVLTEQAETLENSK